MYFPIGRHLKIIKVVSNNFQDIAKTFHIVLSGICMFMQISFVMSELFLLPQKDTPVCLSAHGNIIECHTTDTPAKVKDTISRDIYNRRFYPDGYRLLWINLQRAKFFRGKIKMYLPLTSFLQTDMTQVVEIPPRVRQELTYFYMVIFMGAGILAPFVARASASIMLVMLNRNYSVPARWGLVVLVTMK